ncbi:cation:proton antiporter [Litorilituus lipolyticus]|uniref:Sodium:proton antiporter n=1 Tax=Litorilituus lipolyticus TaxID=2491017 RepID=A0A502KVV2_9GAMM|nr:cation:proton antiporter [Litorilituus lipolyticus]TPH15900.1 sodium:proton antiporter [Litorilituus lipolyticus]
MHDHQAIILTALLILIFGLFSKLADNSPITGPMFFATIGLLCSPLGFNVISVEQDSASIKLIAELTLIIILFVDASFIELKHLKARLQGLPARLLILGLPMTMLLGSMLALLILPEYSIWSVVLLALILSPTDAALGQAVVKSESVPVKVRESISTESGLNDGISLPPIFICLAVIASGTGHISSEDHWLKFVALQLLLGPAIGALVGVIGGKLIDYANDKAWMNDVFQRLTCLSIAILAYSFAESVSGNGFIAAFCSGLFLSIKNVGVRARIQEFGETEGQLLTLFVFLIFGLVFVPTFAPFWDVSVFIYALLSLTVIRILPVFICLWGAGLDNYSKIFIAWFGPRGIASILYLLIAIDQIGIQGNEKIFSVIVLTVLMSVFTHGITAVSMSNKFSKKELKNT